MYCMSALGLQEGGGAALRGKLQGRNKQVSLHSSIGRLECCFLSGDAHFMLVPFSFALIRFAQELSHDCSNLCVGIELQ